MSGSKLLDLSGDSSDHRLCFFLVRRGQAGETVLQRIAQLHNLSVVRIVNERFSKGGFVGARMSIGEVKVSPGLFELLAIPRRTRQSIAHAKAATIQCRFGNGRFFKRC